MFAEGKEWEDIIPEHLRDKMEEEERQQQLLQLHLPPRSRKTIKQVCGQSRRQYQIRLMITNDRDVECCSWRFSQCSHHVVNCLTHKLIVKVQYLNHSQQSGGMM